MQRRRPSEDELDAIVKLRQSGASWLEIQRETLIPRRTAKLAYEGWERQQSTRELQKVRMEVAADEFRRHIDTLTKFASVFLHNINVRGSPGEMTTADAALDDLWRMDILGEQEPSRLQGAEKDKYEHRIIRQNLMLFRSLYDHTGGVVRWEALDEWKSAWNRCVATLALLRKQGRELLDNYLRQEPRLKEKVDMGAGATDALELMLGGLLWAVWQAIRTGKYKDGYPLFRASEGSGFVEVTTSEGTPALRLKFSEHAPAAKAATVCTNAARTLCSRDTGVQLDRELASLQKIIDEIEEMLDPLVLRPLILKTRCELCPV